MSNMFTIQVNDNDEIGANSANRNQVQPLNAVSIARQETRH